MNAQTSPPRAHRTSAVVVRKGFSAGWVVGVVVKRTYAIVGGRCVPARDQVPLVEEPIHDEDGQLVHDTDLVLGKRSADIIVEGHAYAPRRCGAFEARVEVGPFVRRVAVFGPRRLARRVDGSVAFSSPEAVDSVELSWRNAYGGVDHTALGEIGDPTLEMAKAAGHPATAAHSVYAYPRNPYGRGYLIEASDQAIRRCQLPSLEDPGRRLTPRNFVRQDFMRWPEAPAPAGMGWLGYDMFPRPVQFGLPATPFLRARIEVEAIEEVRTGVVQARSLDPTRPVYERIDAGLTQGSAVGMRALEVAPNAPVVLQNLHRERERSAWSLPGEVPRLGLQTSGGGRLQPPLRIRTLILRPDRDQVCAVWTAEARLEHAPREPGFPEIEHSVTWC